MTALELAQELVKAAEGNRYFECRISRLDLARALINAEAKLAAAQAALVVAADRLQKLSDENEMEGGIDVSAWPQHARDALANGTQALDAALAKAREEGHAAGMTEMRRHIEKLIADTPVETLHEQARRGRCSFCGWVPELPPQKDDSVMQAHIRACEKHPLAAALRERDAYAAAAHEALDEYEDAIPSVPSNGGIYVEKHASRETLARLRALLPPAKESDSLLRAMLPKDDA